VKTGQDQTEVAGLDGVSELLRHPGQRPSKGRENHDEVTDVDIVSDVPGLAGGR